MCFCFLFFVCSLFVRLLLRVSLLLLNYICYVCNLNELEIKWINISLDLDLASFDFDYWAKKSMFQQLQSDQYKYFGSEMLDDISFWFIWFSNIGASIVISMNPKIIQIMMQYSVYINWTSWFERIKYSILEGWATGSLAFDTSWFDRSKHNAPKKNDWRIDDESKSRCSPNIIAKIKSECHQASLIQSIKSAG